MTVELYLLNRIASLERTKSRLPVDSLEYFRYESMILELKKILDFIQK